MTDRERFLKCCLGEDADRPPYWLCHGPWGFTWRRWQREGMPSDFESYEDVRRYFNAEAAPQVVHVKCGPCPDYGQRTIEETDEWFVFIDSWDIKRRDLKGHESMSEFLEFPVKNRNDWERFRTERLDPDHPNRLKGDWLQTCNEWMNRDKPIQLGSYPDVSLFGGVRWMLGDEECLIAFYTMPDVIHEMMEHLTNLYLHIFQKVVDAGVRVDVVHIWEDMCGRQGPLISPDHFREFMTPRYKRIKEFADRNNIPLMSVDTDGDPNLIVPPMMEVGVNYLWPMEVAAGADVNVFQERYPSLAMMGGFDKIEMGKGKEAIDKYFESIAPYVEKGGYIPFCDHRCPPNVKDTDYLYYLDKKEAMFGLNE